MMLQVKEKPAQARRYKKLVDLPKSQKQLFKRIVRGNGKFNDYNLIN